MKKLSGLSILKKKDGVTAIVVGISLVVLVGFAALAIDIGHLCVARNELQNAADAGALAGAAVLYNDDGTAVNTGANQVAYDMARANNSEKVAVDVNWTSGNEGDVQRGHWCFGIDKADGDILERGFKPNNSDEPVVLWGVSTKQLDQNEDFINAVRVVARRQGTPVASFFARIFGHESFELSQEAIAYIGFAGKLLPHDVDQPLAICKQSITDGDGNYNCNVGRMLNSGGDSSTHNTAGWTNFSQPCQTASASDMSALICAGDDGTGGNPDSLEYGSGMGATGGVQDTTFGEMKECWEKGKNDLDDDGVREAPIDTDGDGIPDQPWELTLPVVDCPGNNVSNCAELKGAVTLNIVWMVEKGFTQGAVAYNEVPIEMAGVEDVDDWSSSDPDGEARWGDFVGHFGLQNVDGTSAPYARKSIYFLPDCTPHDPVGVSGGENFGVLAKIPVLVK